MPCLKQVLTRGRVAAPWSEHQILSERCVPGLYPSHPSSTLPTLHPLGFQPSAHTLAAAAAAAAAELPLLPPPA